MIKIFPKTSTVCIKCGTPLQGKNVLFIGDDAYCSEHYDKELEKPDNDIKKSEMDWFAKHFDT